MPGRQRNVHQVSADASEPSSSQNVPETVVLPIGHSRNGLGVAGALHADHLRGAHRPVHRLVHVAALLSWTNNVDVQRLQYSREHVRPRIRQRSSRCEWGRRGILEPDILNRGVPSDGCSRGKAREDALKYSVKLDCEKLGHQRGLGVGCSSLWIRLVFRTYDLGA